MDISRPFEGRANNGLSWSSIFDEFPDLVVIYDEKHGVVDANKALREVLRSISGVEIPHGKPLQKDNIPNFLLDCPYIECKDSSLPAQEREVELSELDKWFKVTVTPKYDEQNRLIGCIHVARDITIERRLRDQLIHAGKMVSFGHMLSGVVHELNNPLAGIMGYSELLLNKQFDYATLRQNVEKLYSQAERASKIAQNLLSFSRPQKMEREYIDINSAIQAVLDMRGYELRVENIKVMKAFSSQPLFVLADPYQLQQVFLDILINAEQAILEVKEGGELSIRTSLDNMSSRIVVEFCDSGPGIPQENLEKIFDPFFTTKTAGNGTGLGLSISRNIIREHGGEIYAQSTPREGATFIIEFPCVEKFEWERDIIPSQRAYVKSTGGRNILLVDDEEPFLDVFSQILIENGHAVDSANNAKSALDKVKKGSYDFVITDLKMPELDGRWFYEQIKKLKPELAPKIIFSTGDVASFDAQAFLQESGNRYLEKPFKVEELEEVMLEVSREIEDRTRKLESGRSVRQNLPEEVNPKTEKILIVDDEESTRDVLSTMLGLQGYTCISSHDAIDAIRKLDTERFDLVLADIRMPGMDGIELLREIRAKHGDRIAVMVVTAVTELKTAIEAMKLGAWNYIAKPFEINEIILSVERALERHRLIQQNWDYQRNLERKVAEQAAEIRNLFLHAMMSLTNALEAKDIYTRGHSIRVKDLSLGICRQMEVGDHSRIGLASSLHDLGKIGVRESILGKMASLTKEEYEHIKTHPEIGERILRPLIKDEEVLKTVRNHQEWFDGTGYPDGLKGADIPLGARIIAVADAYDALTSPRPYRSARSTEEAYRELRRCSVSQFDPDVIEAFMDMQVA